MKKYIFILLAAMAFVACSEDEENELIGPVAEIPADEVPDNIKTYFGNRKNGSMNFYFSNRE